MLGKVALILGVVAIVALVWLMTSGLWDWLLEYGLGDWLGSLWGST